MISTALLCLSCAENSEPALPQDVGVTYYVSSSGSDNNSGTSEQQPWKTLEKVNVTVFSTGDKILFKSGEQWSGKLYPKGSGSETNPIAISNYGTGDKPQINGDGVSGALGGAVVLYNQDHWVISNLEITNKPADGVLADGVQVPRFGIIVRWHDYGTGRNIRIDNCNIHDIAGMKNIRFSGEGIMIVATGSDQQTNYEDVIIENCRIVNIDRTGISIWSQWHQRGNIFYGTNSSLGDADYHATKGAYKAAKGVIIRGNYLSDTGGDGIIVSCTENAIIEHNTLYRANQNRIGGNAGMWPHNSDGTIMQYNEVAYTRVSGDGQAIDIDILCSDVISQYNFTHHNEGGSHLVCSDGNAGSTSRNTIRYNISYNDGHRSRIFTLTGTTDNTYIHNNVIYQDNPLNATEPETGLLHATPWNGSPKNTYFFNNIIHFNKGGHNASYFDTYLGTSFFASNNCWWGSNTEIRMDPTINGSMIADPKFVSTTLTGTGLESLEGFKLQNGSPCIGVGTVGPKRGVKDFWGTAIPASGINIGAHQTIN